MIRKSFGGNQYSLVQQHHPQTGDRPPKPDERLLLRQTTLITDDEAAQYFSAGTMIIRRPLALNPQGKMAEMGLRRPFPRSPDK
jgi:hypothetical protein